MTTVWNWGIVVDAVISSLAPNEREGAVAYLEQQIIPEGEVLPHPEIKQCFSEPIVIAFVDLEPMLNWAHQGRYLVLNMDGVVLCHVNVDYPPFLRSVSPYLRLIYQGSDAPDWTVVAPPLELQ